MSEDAHRHRVEPGGVSNRRVAMFAAGYMGLLAASIGILYAVYAGKVPPDHKPAVRQFPPPRLEGHPSAALDALLAKQRVELNRYGWANADRTLVKIPIERAMGIIAARGAHAYDPIESAQPPAANPPTGGAR
jgi:hypothetical protein